MPWRLCATGTGCLAVRFPICQRSRSRSCPSRLRENNQDLTASHIRLEGVHYSAIARFAEFAERCPQKPPPISPCSSTLDHLPGVERRCVAFLPDCRAAGIAHPFSLHL
ncbi:hypothetical protein P154DRAFT_518020 [Amniculicola lignicola CBS 123094]|uniref:Uncharacterized protein n=1 Tax=Amniculicola lignicola CBS 123094 TaxID=1392246 RepID=A0A6A5X004_9PLEO|nr:hypothetical protein P154DRAFT_518020 [Amniculicola lignicola CBS 123094]